MDFLIQVAHIINNNSDKNKFKKYFSANKIAKGFRFLSASHYRYSLCSIIVYELCSVRQIW